MLVLLKHTKGIHYVRVCIYSFLRYPGTGILEKLDELENPELKLLTSKLPNTALHNHADRTDKEYLGAFKRWKT